MTDKFHFDPLADFQNYREAMRTLLENGWVLPRDLMPTAINAIVIPVDVIDNGTELVVKANLPGVKPEDVSIRVLGDSLTIKATMNEDDELRGSTYLRHERLAESFVRSLKLPVPVIAARAEARFKNGVLILSLPKSENVRPRVIKVTPD